MGSTVTRENEKEPIVHVNKIRSHQEQLHAMRNSTPDINIWREVIGKQ